MVPIAKGWRSWLTRDELRLSWKPWLRGTAIGFPIGTIPAGGADVSTFLSYATEKKLAVTSGSPVANMWCTHTPKLMKPVATVAATAQG